MRSRSRSVTLSQGTSAMLALATVIAVATNPQAKANPRGARTGKEMGNGQYSNVNGLKMYYEVHGSGRPLVLLHGAFGTAETWAAVLPTLVKNRQVIILEQQGQANDRPQQQNRHHQKKPETEGGFPG